MARHHLRKSVVVGLAAWSLLASSVASAASAPPGPANPLVAVSVFGTAESSAAVCGADCVAMTAAAAQYEGGSNSGGGSGMWILAGVLLAMVAAFFLLEDTVLSGDGIEITPISPA